VSGEEGSSFHKAVMLATEEARATGSRKIEAEHILLALTRQEGTDAREVLDSAGLDHDAVMDAIEREFEQSLLSVGVSVKDKDVIKSTGKVDYKPRMAQSAKLALGRAYQRAKTPESKRFPTPIEPIHLLLGTLDAKAGTVPRVLEIAGVDPQDLTKRAETALNANS